jgi:hypothetical protein
MEHQGQRNGEGGHHDQRIRRYEKVRRLERKKMRRPRRSHCSHGDCHDEVGDSEKLPNRGLRIMRYEPTDREWAAIRPRRRLNDRHILNGRPMGRTARLPSTEWHWPICTESSEPIEAQCYVA